MKINFPSNEPVRLDSGAKAPAKSTPQPAGADGAMGGVATRLSSIETQLSADSGIDRAKVDSIKQAISDGTFKVNAEVVADKLIASAQEMRGKKAG